MIFLAAMLWPRPRHPRVGRVLGCEDFDEDVDKDGDEDFDKDVDEDIDLDEILSALSEEEEVEAQDNRVEELSKELELIHHWLVHPKRQKVGHFGQPRIERQ